MLWWRDDARVSASSTALLSPEASGSCCAIFSLERGLHPLERSGRVLADSLSADPSEPVVSEKLYELVVYSISRQRAQSRAFERA